MVGGCMKKTEINNMVDFSPRANHTDNNLKRCFHLFRVSICVLLQLAYHNDH